MTEPAPEPEKRLKRLNQLAVAREKAAAIKKLRSAPKKELKQLKEDMKERLYQEEVEKVQQFKQTMSARAECAYKGVPINKDLERIYKGVPINKDLEDLISILYS